MARKVIGDVVHVYNDGPVWADVLAGKKRWFQLKQWELDSHYVVSYELSKDAEGYVMDADQQVAWIEKQHTDCIFVY